MLKIYKDNKDDLKRLQDRGGEVREKVLEVKQDVYKAEEAADKGLDDGMMAAVYSLLSVLLGMTLETGFMKILLYLLGVWAASDGYKKVKKHIEEKERASKDATAGINELIYGGYTPSNNSNSYTVSVEQVKKMKEQSKKMKANALGDIFGAAMYSVFGTLFITDTVQIAWPDKRIFNGVVWIIVGIVNAYLAGRKLNRAKEIKNDEIILEEELSEEQRMELNKKK